MDDILKPTESNSFIQPENNISQNNDNSNKQVFVSENTQSYSNNNSINSTSNNTSVDELKVETANTNNNTQDFLKKIKKSIIFLIVGALALGALVTLFMYWTGNYSSILRPILTVIYIIILGIFGLINVSTYGKVKLKMIPILGNIFAIIASFIMIYLIYSTSNVFTIENHYSSVFYVSAIALTQVGLLLLTTLKNNYVRYIALVTIMFVLIYTLIDIFIVLSNYNIFSGNIFTKIYITFLILNITGTLVTYILYKLNKNVKDNISIN